MLDEETCAGAPEVACIVLDDIVYWTIMGRITHLHLECRSIKSTHRDHELIWMFCMDESMRRTEQHQMTYDYTTKQNARGHGNMYTSRGCDLRHR